MQFNIINSTLQVYENQGRYYFSFGHYTDNIVLTKLIAEMLKYIAKKKSDRATKTSSQTLRQVVKQH